MKAVLRTFAPLCLAALTACGGGGGGASESSRTLHDAAWTGDFAAVTRMLDAGADPNPRRRDGITPLHRATLGGHLEVARLLLDRGADPNPRDKNRYTPLHLATLRGHLEVVRLLLDRGADPNTRDEPISYTRRASRPLSRLFPLPIQGGEREGRS